MTVVPAVPSKRPDASSTFLLTRPLTSKGWCDEPSESSTQPISYLESKTPSPLIASKRGDHANSACEHNWWLCWYLEPTVVFTSFASNDYCTRCVHRPSVA